MASVWDQFWSNYRDEAARLYGQPAAAVADQSAAVVADVWEAGSDLAGSAWAWTRAQAQDVTAAAGGGVEYVTDYARLFGANYVDETQRLYVEPVKAAADKVIEPIRKAADAAWWGSVGVAALAVLAVVWLLWRKR